jgi:acetoacetate decarboxylase
MWLSVFAVRTSDQADRPPGLYGAAFVDYGGDGVLSYHELLVARLVRSGRTPRVRVTDIWVDSVQSRDGGRSLWAIPKDLADLSLSDSGAPVARTSFAGSVDGLQLASGSFTAVPRAALVRTPFVSTLTQLRDDGTEVLSKMSGSSKALPCRASWVFPESSPLAWLGGRKPLLSFRLDDLRLTFGA